jgi:transcription initiation factor TFIIE subunit alpha
VLGSFDVAAWVKNNLTDSEKQKTSQDSSGLKIAGSDPNKKEDEGIGIVMSMDKDEAQQQLERAAKAEAKRQQNALPAWHLKSTITGDLTALGVKENARQESAIAANAIPGSNDEILRGLGVVGARPERDQHQPMLYVMEDVKPLGNSETDCKFFPSFQHLQELIKLFYRL